MSYRWLYYHSLYPWTFLWFQLTWTWWTQMRIVCISVGIPWDFVPKNLKSTCWWKSTNGWKREYMVTCRQRSENIMILIPTVNSWAKNKLSSPYWLKSAQSQINVSTKSTQYKVSKISALSKHKLNSINGSTKSI